MIDWTKQPFQKIPMRGEAYFKKRALKTQRSLQFIACHPDGVTAKDFEDAGVQLSGIERLVKLKLIAGTQIKEPERGPRCYHWLWKIRKAKENS